MIITFLISFLILLLVLCFAKNHDKCRFPENEVTTIYQSDSTEDVKKKVSYILLFGKGWEYVNEDVYNIENESISQRFYCNGDGRYLNVTLVKDEKYVYVGYAYKNIVSKFHLHDDEFFNLIKSLL